MSGLVSQVASSSQVSLTEQLIALKRIVPKAIVARALHVCGKDQSFCRVMPAWLVVWFVVGLGLFHRDSYRQVYRHLIRKGLAPLRTTLCEARQRVGVRPLAIICKRVVQLLASPLTPGAFYAGMRLMAIDGFTIDVYDSPANEKAFGRPGSGRGRSAYPQARVLCLCEAGTHVMWRWLIRKYSVGESTIARHLIRQLQPDMLLLWDKNFFKFGHVKQVLAQKANLLAIVRKDLILLPIRRLSDGSYLAKIYRNAKARSLDLDGVTVRVIEYTLDEPRRKGHGEKHRLITTLLDPAAHPARTLIDLYHVRWEEELTIDELKTHQMIKPLLKSETPAGVIQEIYGVMLGHFVIRTLMFQAAASRTISPLRISFVGTLNILEVRLPQYPKTTAAQKKWQQEMIEEISREILPPRPDRINPRVIKRKMSKWKKKQPQHRNYPQPTKTFSQSVELIC